MIKVLLKMLVLCVLFLFAGPALSDAHNEPELIPVPQELPKIKQDGEQNLPLNYVVVVDEEHDLRITRIIPMKIFERHRLVTGQEISPLEWALLYNNGENHEQ